jgi:hypothetical protein
MSIFMKLLRGASFQALIMVGTVPVKPLVYFWSNKDWEEVSSETMRKTKEEVV